MRVPSLTVTQPIFQLAGITPPLHPEKKKFKCVTLFFYYCVSRQTHTPAVAFFCRVSGKRIWDFFEAARRCVMLSLIQRPSRGWRPPSGVSCCPVLHSGLFICRHQGRPSSSSSKRFYFIYTRTNGRCTDVYLAYMYIYSLSSLL
jgi:hypothetical protein